MSSTARIADWRHVDPSTFRDRIVPKNQPAVLRDVVTNVSLNRVPND
jgi:hypothetical protein